MRDAGTYRHNDGIHFDDNASIAELRKVAKAAVKPAPSKGPLSYSGLVWGSTKRRFYFTARSNKVVIDFQIDTWLFHLDHLEEKRAGSRTNDKHAHQSLGKPSEPKDMAVLMPSAAESSTPAVLRGASPGVSPEDVAAMLKEVSEEYMKLFLVDEEVLTANEQFIRSTGVFNEAAAADFIEIIKRFACSRQLFCVDSA